MTGGNPDAVTGVSVVVPAADEQERIEACLHALGAAAARLWALRRIPATITVVLDGCRDGTAEVVARFPAVHAVASAARCVGAARALGTAAALDGRAAGLWTAHTDADSQVPPDWLTTMVAVAEAGADLVLGTVLPSLELPLPVLRAWQSLHALTDGHPHVHGANLGIRAGTLHAVGSWRPLPTGEDVDLVTRARQAGARIRSVGGIAVRTSARPDGRAPHGFSGYLRALA